MAVPRGMFDFVLDAMKAAGCDHAILDDTNGGPVSIDMHGVALVAEEADAPKVAVKVIDIDETREAIYHWSAKSLGDEVPPIFWHSIHCALDELELTRGYVKAMVDDMRRWCDNAPEM